MRKGLVAGVFAGLVGLLLAVPSQAGNCGYGGSYYYGTSSSYTPVTYYQPVVQTPVYSAPAAYTPNPYNIDTLFRVAPELAYGRINEEVAGKSAKAAVELFKAELQQQEAQRQKEADRARQERLLTSMESALQQQGAILQQLLSGRPVTDPNTFPQAPGGDPEKARMAEEIRQLRAILEQQQQQGQQPKPPAPPKLPNPPEIPPAKGGNPPKAPAGGGNAIQTVSAAFTGSKCLDCHGGNKPSRMNLSDPGRLTRENWKEVYYRLTTNQPRDVMPPPDSGHTPMDINAVNAVASLIATTTN